MQDTAGKCVKKRVMIMRYGCESSSVAEQRCEVAWSYVVAIQRLCVALALQAEQACMHNKRRATLKFTYNTNSHLIDNCNVSLLEASTLLDMGQLSTAQLVAIGSYLVDSCMSTQLLHGHTGGCRQLAGAPFECQQARCYKWSVLVTSLRCN